MKPKTITVSILETVTDKQFEDIPCIFRIVEGVCGAEPVKELPPTPKRPPQNGYQPTHGNLDKSNPPQNGSGVPNHKQAVTCPVCCGTGHVDAGFYMRTGPEWSSTGGTEPCKSCSGKGYVIV